MTPTSDSSYSPLETLAAYLSGEFENAAQAAEASTWFVHLRLWQKRVPALTSANIYTFFLEQQSVGTNKPPYRQRILQIKEVDGTAAEGHLQGQYFALAQPSQFIGAATDDARLNSLTAEALVPLPNSKAHIQYQRSGSGYKFQSALPEGKLCSFEYAGQTRYVYLGFDIEQTANGSVLLLTYDKGIDPDTGRGLWGALMGPFQMIKSQ